MRGELLSNLPAYAIQSALLLVVGLCLPRWLHYTRPNARILYYRLLLCMVVFFPCVGFWWTSIHPPTTEIPLVVSFPEITHDVFSNIDPPEFFSAFALAIGLISLLFALRLAGGIFILKRFCHNACPYQNHSVVLSTQKALNCSAMFFLSDRIDSPITFGWIKPIILLPRNFDTFSIAQQRAIVCHELLHVKRRDWLYGIIEEIVRVILWFHPAVWILINRICLWREKAVDLEVVRFTQQRKIYLETLQTFAVRQDKPIRIAAFPLTARNHLLKRVKFMVQNTRISKTRLIASLPLFAGALALAGITGTIVFPMQSHKSAPLAINAAFAGSLGKSRTKNESRTADFSSTPYTAARQSSRPKTNAPPKATQNVTATRINKPQTHRPKFRPPARRTDRFPSARKEQTNFHIQPKASPTSKNQPSISNRSDLPGPHTPIRPPEPTPVGKPVASVATQTPSGLFTKPLPTHKVQPIYPKEIKNLENEVVVTARLHVNTQGVVDKAEIHHFSDQRFKQSVLEAVRQWKFKPATHDGKPIDATTLVRIRFVSECYDPSPITGSHIPRRCRKKS